MESSGVAKSGVEGHGCEDHAFTVATRQVWLPAAMLIGRLDLSLEVMLGAQ